MRPPTDETTSARLHGLAHCRCRVARPVRLRRHRTTIANAGSARRRARRPALQAPAAGQRPSQGGRGRGRGGGRKDDPINADVDWTKQPPRAGEDARGAAEDSSSCSPAIAWSSCSSDPIIQEPTAIAFDGNGRMFVVEDRSYMLDLDMTGQLDPISRISLHVDTNNDGVYDKHTVFVDNLVFPRFVTPFGPNTILTKESNAQEVWKYTDTNGDGVADKKELFDTGYGRLGEHRGPGSVPDLGARQLDVQHLQRVPRALDAARRHQGADRQQRRRVGRHAGQRRQDLVRERRARRAGRAFSSRSSTATSTCPTSSSRTSGFPGARRSASPTCRAA